jgi:hypothetical protein
MNSTNTLYALPSYPGYEFQWSTGATEYNIDTDIPGLYSVTVTNSNGCSSSKSVDLGSCVDVSITPSISSSGEAMLDAGAGTFGATYSYLWHDGTTNQTIPIDELGFYSVTVVDENGCSGNDKEFVDAYYYDSDNIFLVFATYISPENSTNIEDGELHIYLCNNTGTVVTINDDTKEVIREEIKRAFPQSNYLDDQKFRFIAQNGCDIDHSPTKPVKRNAFKNIVLPLIIKSGVVVRTYENNLPYHFQLIINEVYEYNLQQIYYNSQSEEWEYPGPDFDIDYSALPQEIDMLLKVGKETIENGQSGIVYDPPVINNLKISFKASDLPDADPEELDNFSLYADGSKIDEGGFIEVEKGRAVRVTIKNESTGKLVTKDFDEYLNFQWEENGFPVTQEDSWEIRTINYEDGEERQLSVNFETQNANFSLFATIKVVIPEIILGFSHPTGNDNANTLPCSNVGANNNLISPCQNPPSFYVDLALDELRSHPEYSATMMTLESEFAIKIHFNKASDTNPNIGCGVGMDQNYLSANFGHNEAPLFIGATTRIVLSNITTWGEAGNNLSNSLNGCPNEAMLLLIISEAEEMDIISLIENQTEEENPIALIQKISAVDSDIGALIMYLVNYDPDNIQDYDKELSFYVDKFEALVTENLVRYKLDDYPGPIEDLLSRTTAASNQSLHINLNVDMLDYVPYYSTMNSNQDVRIWYSNNPTCGFDGISGVSTVDEARLRKYTQTIAHEIRHLEYYLNPANTIEAYKWQLLRENDNQNLKYCYPYFTVLSLQNQPIYCSPGAGHEYGNPDSEHACQADEDFKNPIIQGL